MAKFIILAVSTAAFEEKHERESKFFQITDRTKTPDSSNGQLRTSSWNWTNHRDDGYIDFRFRKRQNQNTFDYDGIHEDKYWNAKCSNVTHAPTVANEQ